MKKTNIIMLIIILVGATFLTGFPVLGILEALAMGPITEVYPAVAFFGMWVILGIIAIVHSICELLKEMEVTEEEA